MNPIRAIFEGMTNPVWHSRFDKQLEDDVGGLGNKQGIAIFGVPGNGRSQFVLTSRHMTLRCDGDSSEPWPFIRQCLADPQWFCGGNPGC